MHALHCLLVSLDKWQVDEILANQNNPQKLQEFKMEIRVVAMGATSEYADQAFDWRSEDDAGSWIDDFPGEGVVLGSNEPERFKELLANYSQRPLKRAIELIEELNYYDLGYRFEQEIKGSPGVVIVDRNRVRPGPFGERRYWSGKKGPEIVFNKELAEEIWAGKMRWDMPWTLAKIFRLLDGDYLFESQFYSVPDGNAKISSGVFKDAMEHPEYYALVFSDYHW